MANVDLIGSLSPGLRLGAGIRGAVEEKKQAALGAQQRELLGGLRRRSLGLGGETSEQKQQALTEFAAISPEKTKELQSVIEGLDAPRLASIKLDSELMSRASASVKGMAPEQRPAALQNISQTFAANGHPKLAAGAAKMAQLGPDELDIALTNNQNLGRATEKIIAGREDKIQTDFRKEERQQAKTTVNRLTKRATDINSSFDKIDALLKQKSRAANASVLQLIARLASPGIVTEKEAGALAGGAAPLMALATMFDKGGDEDTAKLVRRSMDPNNPSNFDTEGLSNLAKALTASEVPFIMEELKGAKSRATTANISKAAFDTNFGDTSSIDSLSRFIEADALSETPTAPAPQSPPSGRQGGVLSTDAEGNSAFVFPDGTFEEV